MKLLTLFLKEYTAYTGHELRPHWIAEKTGKFTSALLAFRGGCSVASSELVDVEDAQAGAQIQAKEMLHFLGEFFDENLLLTIAKQRLFIALFLEELRKVLSPDIAQCFFRQGNDLFYRDPANKALRKLSVSIVTASPVSTLLHFGVNIDSSGAPVAAIGLKDFAVDSETLAKNVLKAWEEEMESINKARCKVSPR